MLLTNLPRLPKISSPFLHRPVVSDSPKDYLINGRDILYVCLKFVKITSLLWYQEYWIRLHLEKMLKLQSRFK
jgi:hypothetical protein